MSILIVLACHLLPLGPREFQLNFTAGLLGMSLFFTLSGFLVTNILIKNQDIVGFLIRRLFRILPLAWLYMAISLLVFSADLQTWVAHFLFYANYPPKPFIPHITEHMWSLCVEIHFYLGVALLVALLKKKGLLLIPLICVVITLLRLSQGMYSSVITHFRVDEILTGATLALILGGHLGDKVRDLMTRTNFWVIAVLLLASCHPWSGPLNYLRPYFAALLVGISLTNPDKAYTRFLYHRWLFYVATISYALYVVHPLLAATWLGTGDTLIEKYMKRPLLFAAIFLVAHISTKYYEGPAMRWGKTLSDRWGNKPKPVAEQVSPIRDNV